jgi:hypothetical protein
MIPEGWWNLFGFLSWLWETEEQDAEGAGEEDGCLDGVDSRDEESEPGT